MLNLLDAQGKPVGQALQPFSGKRQDLLTLEDNMFSALQPALAPSSAQPAVAFRPTENTTAYELYLKGRNTFTRGELDPKNVQAAIGYYDQATKADPNFALAWAGLADAYLRVYKSSKDPNASQQALAAAQQANRIPGADSIPEVQYTLGSVLNASGKTAEAVSVLENALALAPNSDEAYRRLGDTYRAAGKKDEAIAAYKKAIELNPYFWFNYNLLGTTSYRFGMYDQALAAFKKVIELDPNNAAAYAEHGSHLLHPEQVERCRQCLREVACAETDCRYLLQPGDAILLSAQVSTKPSRTTRKRSQLGSKDQFLMGNLASGYWFAGDEPKALKAYDRGDCRWRRRNCR